MTELISSDDGLSTSSLCRGTEECAWPRGRQPGDVAPPTAHHNRDMSAVWEEEDPVGVQCVPSESAEDIKQIR